ncbi:diheme cytochrome c-553 [Geojedonia litorea]|uniref:Diheme cytochrome c-553 n=1 Tax=Geojedonia litorea TaxID=1268269 RepID=A0ABV9N6E6_9FLAO
MKTIALPYVAVFCALVCACNSSQKEKPQLKMYEPAKTIVQDPVKRGEHLVNAIGCHDCHTPKKFTEKGMELDTSRLLSGHPSNEALPDYDEKTAKSYVLFSSSFTAAIGPWGISFAGNLTPDPTGTGTWTEAQFINALKNGKYKGLDGSRDLLPPMPWEAYRNLPDEDLKAIFAYLKTVQPVENVVPSPIPPKV